MINVEIEAKEGRVIITCTIEDSTVTNLVIVDWNGEEYPMRNEEAISRIEQGLDLECGSLVLV